MKTIIERGASWTLEETKMLLALWGQDLVQRQATNQKRTKEVYEKISEKFTQNGFERTADQVRTRVFNMIAEYRRILRDPNPERIKKCIFFEALHKIYQAKHMDDVKSALDDYEPEYPYSPASNTISSEKGEESVSDSEALDGNETTKGDSPNKSAHKHINNDSNKTNDSKTIDNNQGSTNAKANNAKAAKTQAYHRIIVRSTPSPEPKTPPYGTPSTSANANNSTNTITTTTTGGSGGANATATTTISNDEFPEHSSKKCKLSSSTPQVAAPAGGTSVASSSTSTPSTQRHQSLLLPHATSAGAATPMSKFTTAGNNTPSYININSTTKLPIIRTNQLIGHSNGSESINLNGTTARLPTTAAITSHQLYQAPVNTFDVTSSALLIDRMFAHLSRESENMREWIALEKERLALERTRRQQETEREHRRDRVLVDTLMRFQEQWLTYMHRIDPRFPLDPKPELKIGLKENSPSGDASQGATQSTINLTTASTAPTTNSTATTSPPTTTTTTTTTTDCSASEENKQTQ